LATEAVYPPPPPPQMEFNGTKLVNDEAHPWMPLREGDVRGPCPGLNTLASHGVRSSFPESNLPLTFKRTVLASHGCGHSRSAHYCSPRRSVHATIQWTTSTGIRT
jgi:hypothetical protein